MADVRTVKSARVVLGAASERVTRLAQTEKLLAGALLDDALFARIRECAAAEARFVSDAHGSAATSRNCCESICANHQRGAPMSEMAAACRAWKPRQGDGRADYVHNMRVPGMLHAKIFRSTIAHGRILSIDTSAARNGRCAFGAHR